MGLAIITELPLVIVNSQRGGPSTGLPTKTEQSDLYQAVYGRNGDAPLVVLATHGPSDCFAVAIEACRLATQFMTPVMVLTDGYIANAAEPWRVPDRAEFTAFPVDFDYEPGPDGRVLPYERDPETLRRHWIKPRHARPDAPHRRHREGHRHRPHQLRARQPPGDDRHPQGQDRRHRESSSPRRRSTTGRPAASLAVVGWGSTYGAIRKGVQRARAKGQDVAHIHIRHIWPLPANLGELLRGYDKVLVPEMNTGQLKTILRDQFLVDCKPLNKVSGHPFKIAEIEAAIDGMLG